MKSIALPSKWFAAVVVASVALGVVAGWYWMYLQTEKQREKLGWYEDAIALHKKRDALYLALLSNAHGYIEHYADYALQSQEQRDVKSYVEIWRINKEIVSLKEDFLQREESLAELEQREALSIPLNITLPDKPEAPANVTFSSGDESISFP